MYSYNKYLYILESKREKELKAKYVDKLGLDEKIFNKFYENKNTEWLLKTYISIPKEKKEEINNKGGKTLEELLLDYSNMFDNNKEKIHEKINDIKSLDDMKEILDSLRDFDSAKDLFDSNIWILDNSYEWFIFKPYSYEASELGNNKKRESNWCTTYDEEYFNKYLGPKGGLLYICNKLDKTKDIALEMNNENINAWNWKDNNIKSDSSLEYIINYIFEPDKEPYKILIKNINKLENDIPKINFDKLRENAKEQIMNMGIEELADLYGSYIIFKYLDDDKILSEIRDSELDRFYSDWKYESDLVDLVIEILKEDFHEWTEKNKKEFFKFIKERIKEKGLENEYDYNDLDLYKSIKFLEKNYDDSDDEKLVEQLNLEYEVVEKLTDNYMNNFRDVQEYLESMYGNNIDGKELSYHISSYDIDMDGLSDDIVEDMSEEELMNYE